MDEVSENNKLIAEFMSLNAPHLLWACPESAPTKFWVSQEFQGIENADGNNQLYPSEMRFHESWDWLMPVVEKYKNLDPEFQSKYLDAIVLWDHRLKEAMWMGIDSLYKEIVEFIKWCPTKSQKT